MSTLAVFRLMHLCSFVLYIKTVSSYVHFSKLSGKPQPFVCQSSSGEEDCQSATPFLAALIEVEKQLAHKFFFPGHNGGLFSPLEALGMGPTLRYDIPELDGLDNIHNPEGPLLTSLKLAADLFGSMKTWFLVNGSTSGVLIAILSCHRIYSMRQKNKVDVQNPPVMLVSRASHKSVFDALNLCQCNAILLPVVFDSQFNVPIDIEYEKIEEAMNAYNGSICGLLLTRPTYQGLLSTSMQFKRIVNLAKSRGIPVIVDEAHGSHLRFVGREDLGDAMACGADVSIQSTHKTLSSLSQTAMLHLSKHAYQSGSGVGIEDIINVHDSFFSMLTTTSPNSVLLASLDAARAQCAVCSTGIEMSANIVDDLRQKIRSNSDIVQLLEDSIQIKSLRERGLLAVDPLRLCVQFKGVDPATDIDDAMCDNMGIYCELNEEACITYAISPYTSYNTTSLNALSEALLGLSTPNITDRYIDDGTPEKLTVGFPFFSELSFLDCKVPTLSGKMQRKLDALLVGCVAAETVCMYPPGVPLLLKGEVIHRHHVSALSRLRDDGMKGSGRFLLSCSDKSLETLAVFN